MREQLTINHKVSREAIKEMKEYDPDLVKREMIHKISEEIFKRADIKEVDNYIDVTYELRIWVFNEEQLKDFVTDIKTQTLSDINNLIKGK